MLSSCVNTLVSGNAGAENRSLIQSLTHGQYFAVVDDDISLFKSTRFFACPNCGPFKPYGALGRAFQIAVCNKRINDLSMDRIGLNPILRGLNFRFAFAYSTPFYPAAIGSLSMAFPNATVHPDIA